MSTLRRFSGFDIRPDYAANPAANSAALAIGDGALTLWSGEPTTVWQTPLSEVRSLEVAVGRRLEVRATIAGVRYRMSTSRDPELDELIELVRTNGGRVVRPRRAMAALVAGAAVVLLAASAATIISQINKANRPVDPPAWVANVTSSDLPAGWHVNNGALLSNLIGTPGQTTTSTTQPPQPSGSWAPVWQRLETNYWHCMGITKAKDRLLGGSGQVPDVQTSGSVYSTSAFHGAEIGSYSQVYATAQMVAKDQAQYSSPRFARCYATFNAQTLIASIAQTTASASSYTPYTPYAPVTFSRVWRRAGVSAVRIPGLAGTYHLVSVLAMSGRREVGYFAFVGDWPGASRVVNASIAAMLARIEDAASSVSA